MSDLEYLEGVQQMLEDYLKNIAHSTCSDYGLLNACCLETVRRIRRAESE